MINSFSFDDIDSVCIMCYNWGITLVELNQYDLAEKFAGKALSLTKYVSTKVSNLKETIQVLIYFVIDCHYFIVIY